MTKLKPIVKLNQIVLGVLYFEASVARDGKLFIGTPFIIRKIEHNHKNLGPFVHTTVFGGMYDDKYLTSHESLCDMGVEVGGKHDNAHRLFRYKHNVFEQLRKIVDAQDLAKYIEVISGSSERTHTVESLTRGYIDIDGFIDDYEITDDHSHMDQGPDVLNKDDFAHFDAPPDTALSHDNFDDFDDIENPFKVGDKVTLNGSLDSTLVELGFKRRKHYTILAINEKNPSLIKVDDPNANPRLGNYVNHSYFKAVPAKAAKEKVAA